MTLELGVGVLPIIPLGYMDGLVRDADALNLHSVMVPDHSMAWFSEALWNEVGSIVELMPSPHVFLDPLPTIAAWAAHTRDIRFGTAVTDPIRRPPAQLAITALSMDHITRGRFILGIGCGEAENCLPYGLPFDHPVARLEEALIIIRRMWTEGRVSHTGRFWTLDSAICRLGPYRDRFPPIWIGAHGPRMLELTGRFGDGWLPFIPMRPERYAERLSVVRQQAERAGRDPNAIVAGLNTPVCIAEDHERAHAMLRSPAMRQLALALDDDFWGQLGCSSPLVRSGVTGYIPEWRSPAELRAALTDAPDPMLAHDLVLHGTPAEVAHQLHAFEQAGLEYFAPLDAASLTDVAHLATASARVAELQSQLTSVAVR